MTHTGSIVSGIEYKLRKLIQKHQELLELLKEKENELVSFRKVSEEQQKIIQELEEKIRTFKITKTIEKKEGAADARERINELVREIDKCIGLLNT
jgi:phage shock protein A